MKIDRIHRGRWGYTVAYFDVEVIDGLLLCGLRLVEGKGGLSIVAPRDKKGEVIIWFHQDVYDKLLEMVNG